MTHHLTIRINVDGLRGQLARALQRTILLTAAGLQGLDRLNPDFLELPVSFTMTLDPHMKWTKEELQKNYSEWILSNGFRDAIESIGALLEEAHRVLSVWDLASTHDGPMRLSGEQWNERVVSAGEKFHALGIPHKLDHLRTTHDLTLDDRLSQHVLSINRARNCLVHRNGIITRRDVAEAGDLVVSWRKLSYLVQDEDGEKPLQIGQQIEKDAVVCIRHDEESKSFTLGQAINFTAPEFSEICWSLFLFGEDLVKKMNALGVRRGIVKDAASSPATDSKQ
jgi:hypothetical protein